MPVGGRGDAPRRDGGLPAPFEDEDAIGACVGPPLERSKDAPVRDAVVPGAREAVDLDGQHAPVARLPHVDDVAVEPLVVRPHCAGEVARAHAILATRDRSASQVEKPRS